MKEIFNKFKQIQTNKKYTLIISVISLVLIIGASYALVTTGVFSGLKHSITSGILAVDYVENTSTVNLTNAIALSDVEGLNATNNSHTFTLLNSGSVSAAYRVRLTDEEVTGMKLDVSKIRYAVKIGTDEWSNPLNVEDSILGRTLWEGELSSGESVQIQIKFWLDTTVTSADSNKKYLGKIRVDSVQLVKKGNIDNGMITVTLEGNSKVTLLKDATYTEAGVSSISDPTYGSLSVSNIKKTYKYYDGEVTKKVSGVDTSKVGVYFITYIIENLSGQLGIANRTVIVNTTSTNLPVLTLTGSETIVNVKGKLLLDEGATATTPAGTTITDIDVSGYVNTNIGGSYIRRYAVKASNGNFDAITRNIIINWSTYVFNYTGGYQTFEVPYTGYYEIGAWGAQGGGAAGALGGYTSGKIYLTQGEQLYVYVGEKPEAGTGGYNGGGDAYQLLNGGGGATDIRYFGSGTPISTVLTCSSPIGLNSRIMVAGAGGGKNGQIGGEGGNLIGATAYDPNYPEYTSGGGTQTSGGIVHNYASSYPLGTDGTFGVGGTGGGTSDAGSSGGGGGGYYAGAGGSRLYSGSWPAGGGSSFISGYAGVNAIKTSTLTNNPRTHSNNTKHYSNMYFIDSNMQSGVNGGNGKAEIKYLGTTEPTRINTNLNGVRYIKDCINGGSTYDNSWVEIQAIKDGNNIALNKTVFGTSHPRQDYGTGNYSTIVDGDIISSNYVGSSATGSQCVTVDLGKEYNLEEVAVWHYWADGRIYDTNTTSVAGTNKVYRTIINNQEIETSNGKRANVYKLKLKIDPNGGTYNSTSSSTNYDMITGETKTIANPTRIGYTFAGWTVQADTGSTINGSSFIMGHANTTITANWVVNTYTVTLNNQSATTTGTTNVTATYGNAMPTITPPTKTNYTFGGYYTQTGGGGTQYYTATGASTGSWNIAADTTLYAKWTANTYTVTLDNQSATTAGTTSVTAMYNSTMPTITKPTKTGYTFGGYYTQAGGGGTQYYTAAGASAKNWDIAADTTLYAKWTPITYTVAYNCNGGTGSTASSSHTYGVAKALSNNACSRIVTGTGGMVYIFSGWATSSGGAVVYSNQQSVSNLASTQGATVTLYAKWSNLFSYPGTYEVVNDSSSNWIVRLKTVGEVNFTPNISVAVDVWMIGGGGGGGGTSSGGTYFCTGGGGGGSGYVQLVSNLSLTSGTAYAVTVGAGGTGGVSSVSGTQGGTSSFRLSANVIYNSAIGGSGGQRSSSYYSGGDGGNGGCGGGGSGYGNGYRSSAGGVNGSDGITLATTVSNSMGANGTGSGETMCEFGQGTPGASNTCATGVIMYGGGGGGGAGHNSSKYGSLGPGGITGGGNGGGNTVATGGSDYIEPTAGLPNTGGGGGGAVNKRSGSSTGGAGGSGIVVIRNHR